MAGAIEFTLVTMSTAVIATSRRAAQGSLARNPYVGLRTPSTMRSDAAWLAGHRAAAHTAPLHMLFNAVMCASLGAAAWHGWRLVVAFIGGAGLVALIGLLIGTAVVAGRAARAADDADRSRPVSYTGDMPNPTNPFSARTTTIFGWLCAVAACGVTVFGLGTIIDGYVLAIHQQLPPNPTFGVRDDIAYSCLPRWYAAQRAGFTWLMFGYGPVLAGSLLLCAVAAIQRRSPWDICALAVGAVLVAIVFVIAAGVHADNVARAITC